MVIKTISAKITPKSKNSAALNPLTTLVSSKTKNTGPIIKLKKKPSGMADKISWSKIIVTILTLQFKIYKLEFKKYKDNIMFWTFCNGSLFGDQNQEKYINEYVTWSRIGFSIDSATPETYQKIRRLDYYKTISRNLENYN